MAGVELAEQLATLAEALKRLEDELARNASWQSLQAGDALSEDDRAHLIRTLEANPIYLAWRNMREATAMLEARQPTPDASTEAVAEADNSTHMAMTLAQALQQIPPEEAEAEPLPVSVAQVLAAEVAAQLVPQAAAVPQEPVLRTAQEREEYDVGKRATQAVERILAIPVIEPMAPRTAAPSPAAPASGPPPTAAPASASEQAPAPEVADDIGHNVPLEAEDLAFLLKPAARVQPASQSPFLKRLVSEAQTLPTKAAALPPADPFMVPPEGAAPAPESPKDEPPPADDKEGAAKPRLARLLKAWSRH